MPIVIQVPAVSDGIYHNTVIDHNIVIDYNIVIDHNTPAKISNISTDPEYAEPVQMTLNGRKRNKSNKKKQNQILKNIIPHKWFIKCPHINNVSQNCNVSFLKPVDIDNFKLNLCELSTKIDQDKFLLTMMKIERPKRTDRRQGNKKEKTVVTYYLPTE